MLGQWILRPTPRGQLGTHNVPGSIPRPQVPRKDRTGVPLTSGELPNLGDDWTANHSHPLRWPKVSCSILHIINAEAARPTT